MLIAGSHYLKLSRVHSIIAFDEGVPQVVDAELLQPFQSTIVEIQIVGIPGKTYTGDFPATLAQEGARGCQKLIVRMQIPQLGIGGCKRMPEIVHVRVLTPCGALFFPTTLFCSPATPELCVPHIPVGSNCQS